MLINTKYGVALATSIFINILLIGFIFQLFKFDDLRANLYRHLANEYGSAQIALIGDSLTRRNSDLAWQIGGVRLNTTNYARDGHTVSQIGKQALAAVSDGNCLVAVMAGTNKINDIDAAQTFELYKQLISQIKERNATPIIMLSPKTDRAHLNLYLSELNQYLKDYANVNTIPIFDVNEALNVDHLLEEPLTVDGVHLTQLAYEKLNLELVPFIKHQFNESASCS